MAELKEPREVFNEAYTRYPGTITLTVPELEKLLRASASIHDAAKEGKLDVVKNLLKKNPAILDITNKKGRTPLYVAAMKGKYDVVKYFLEESHADAFVLDKHGWAPFHEMAQRGWLKMVKELVQKNPSAVNIKTNKAGTALDIAENICYKGADCSSVVEYLKTLSIHEAAKEGKLNVVKNLLKKNPASLDITNNQGQTPLFLAAREGHLEVVKFFVEEAKADAFIKDKQFGATPLHWSAWNGNLDLVKYLVEINPESIDITNNQGETPLEVAKRCTASSADCSSVVEYLKTFKN